MALLDNTSGTFLGFPLEYKGTLQLIKKKKTHRGETIS